MIKGYREFISHKNLERIDENMAGAKKIIKDIYIFGKAAGEVSDIKLDRSGAVLLDKDNVPVKISDIPQDIKSKIENKVKEIKLTPEELQRLERNQKLQEVREMVKGREGYAQLFTYFYIIELVPIDSLKEALKGLIEYNDLLGKMRRPISNYIDPNIVNNFEQLSDDIEELSRWRKLKKFLDEFTSVLKNDYKNTPKVYKDKLVDIAAAFDELGRNDETGKIDITAQRSIQKRFFDKIKRHKSIAELITKAEEFLKSEAGADSSKFYGKIDECNETYGKINGAKLLYDEGGLIIVEVLSFQACKFLYSNTSWCIATQQYHWDSYVGSEDKYTRQYCVTNFNLSPADNKSIIGLTMGPNGRPTACHLKNDGYAMDSYMSIFAQFEKDLGLEKGFIFDGMKPMTPEDIERKKKRNIANREVVKPGLTLDQLKKYINEDGADVNAQSSKALENAVEEADESKENFKESYEKIKWLLDQGANPNLKSETESVVNKVKSFDVLKLLIAKNAKLTKSAFRQLADNLEAVKFCLENGLDPNFNNNQPMRLAIKLGRLDIIKLLEEHGVVENNRRASPIKIAAENKRLDVLEYFINKGGIYSKDIHIAMNWVSHAIEPPGGKLTKADKVEVLEFIQKFIDNGKLIPSEEAVYELSPGKKITYKEVLSKWKNLKEFYIDKFEK
jgi:hypothetical protein